MSSYLILSLSKMSIEGNPFIIRFKTSEAYTVKEDKLSIEGNPFIIRFKTMNSHLTLFLINL